MELKNKQALAAELISFPFCLTFCFSNGSGCNHLGWIECAYFAACLVLFVLITYVTIGKFSIFQMHIWLVFLVFLFYLIKKGHLKLAFNNFLEKTGLYFALSTSFFPPKINALWILSSLICILIFFIFFIPNLII